MTALVAGESLACVTVPLAPQRSKHKPVMRGGQLDMRPDKAWASWRAAAVMVLRSQWRGRAPIHAPVLPRIVAVFERPKKPRLTYTIGGVERPYPWEWTPDRVPFIGTPDWDQVGKAAIDVVKQAGILVDDPLLVGVAHMERWYAAEGERPSVTIELFAAVLSSSR